MDSQDKTNNLCFECKNALGGCPWTERFEPVPGWDAEPLKGSYHIKACPLWEEDTTQKAEEIDSAGIVNLMSALLADAAKSYKRAIQQRYDAEERIVYHRQQADQIEQGLKFADSEIKRVEMLLPKWVTEKLRKQAREERARIVEGEYHG